MTNKDTNFGTVADGLYPVRGFPGAKLTIDPSLPAPPSIEEWTENCKEALHILDGYQCETIEDTHALTESLARQIANSRSVPAPLKEEVKRTVDNLGEQIVFVTGDESGVPVSLVKTDVDSFIFAGDPHISPGRFGAMSIVSGDNRSGKSRVSEQIKELAKKHEFNNDVIILGGGSSHRHYLPGMGADDLELMYPHVARPLDLKQTRFPKPENREFVSNKMMALLRRGVPGLKKEEESSEPQQG